MSQETDGGDEAGAVGKASTNGSLSDLVEERAMLAAIVAGGAAAFLICWYAIDILLLIFAGAVMGNLFGGLADKVEKLTPLGYRAAFAIVLIVLAVLLGLTVWLFAVQIADQTERLSEQLPEAARELAEPLRRYDWTRRLLEGPLLPEQILRDQPQVISKATDLVSSTVTAATAAGVVLFLGIFTGFNPTLYCRGFLRLVPPRRRSRAEDVLHRLGHTLRWWLVAHFSSMAVVGALTGIGLAVLGIPLALILAVIAGLLAFVPNIGPVVSAIPAVILAFAQSPRLALYVILLYVGVQVLESNLITPIFELRAVSLPPALTVSVQILLGALVGLLGVLVASPLCASVMVLIQALYVEDFLGERPEPELARQGEAANARTAKPGGRS